MGWAILPVSVRAQAISPEVRDRFLSDPEFAEPRDPLLPDLPVVRPLSPLERLALAAALDELAADAERLYLQGQVNLAFEAWLQEVRLRRIFGYVEELKAIQRVGLRAWENARTQEVQLLTLRLRQIQTALLEQVPLNNPLLEEVAASFEILRDIDSAIAVYEALVVRAGLANALTERQRLLENLARLQETWFRFDVASKTYQSLLSTLGNQGDSLKRVQYLQGAIRNYQDAGQLPQALDYQRRLLAHYEATGQITSIPALLLAIARNHRTLEDLTQARTYYLLTHSTALAQRQSDIARDAVQDLADIYLSLGRPDDVSYLYQQQLALERVSYDAYGLMQTFDQLGQFYIDQGEPETAILAYREALVLSNHLSYRTAYFKYRLQRLLLEQNRLTVAPAPQHQGSVVGNLQSPNTWNENSQ